MNKLQALSLILEEIKNTSVCIKREMVPLVQDLADKDSTIIFDIIQIKPEIDEENAALFCERLTEQILSDAISVCAEIDSFSERVVDAKKTSAKKTPFLTRVWLGDVYDVKGLEAMRELLANLTTNRVFTNQQDFVERVVTDWEEA